MPRKYVCIVSNTQLDEMRHIGANMRQVDWSDLKLFLTFIRSGTTRNAGEQLGISHSTVARRLDVLSENAGAALYFRNTDGLQLTSAGQELLETATRIEDEITTFELRSFGQNQELEGLVTLSTGDALSVKPFLSIIADFIKKYPKIDLRLITSVSISDLDRQEADLALRFGNSPSDHLVGRRLTETARAIYASHDYAERFLANPNGQELGWISFSAPDDKEGWKKSTPYPNLPTHLRCADMRTQQIACRSGIGIVLLPCFLCDPDPDLCRVSEPEFVARQDLWLLRHSEMRKNARVRALSDHIVASISKLKPLLHGKTGKAYAIKDAK